MAVIRQGNWLGQQRVDLPHLRSVESAVCADMDLGFGQIISGSNPYVVSGFETITTGAIGASAETLQIITANGYLMHPLASESGTIFNVPSDRPTETLNASNARVQGSFTSNSVNYVGIDLRRSPDSSTTDLVQFLNTNSNTESPDQVPLARTLDYIFLISSQDFTQNPAVCPLVKVTTDASNNITKLEDARPIFTRLGSGGSVPNPKFAYPWPGGRSEVGDNSDFSIADKKIGSLKGWMNATMTRVWELGGGEYWYRPTADRNVKFAKGGSTFTNGEYFEWTGTNLHWQGLKFLFDNSTGWFNNITDQTSNLAGLTDLADGECVYVDIDRTQNLSGGSALKPKKIALTLLGAPTVPGSRYILAWRSGTVIYSRESSFPVGATFNVATTSALGIVQLDTTPLSALAPVVANVGTDGAVTHTNASGSGIVGKTVPTNWAIVGQGGNSPPPLSGLGGGVYGWGGGNTGAGAFFLGGTTNGPGLISTGGTSGNAGVLVSQGSTQFVPTLTTQQSYGVTSGTKTILDHTGFLTLGQNVLRIENWETSVASVSSNGTAVVVPGLTKWATTLASTPGTVSLNLTPTSTFVFPVAKINLSSAGAASAFVFQPVPIVHSSWSGLTLVAEWEGYLDTGAANTTFYMGLLDVASNGDFSTTPQGAWFSQNGAPGGNWAATSVGGVGSGVLSTGITFAVNTWYKFRIEIHGSASAYTSGGVYRTRMFINGGQTNTMSGTQTSQNAALSFAFGFKSTSAATGNMYCSPVTITYNRYDSSVI